MGISRSSNANTAHPVVALHQVERAFLQELCNACRIVAYELQDYAAHNFKTIYHVVEDI